MNIDKTIEKLTPVFNSVAEKIGQGTEFGWEVVVRQQYAYGIKDLIVGIILMILFTTILTLSIKFGKNLWKKSGDEDLEKETYQTLSILFYVAPHTVIWIIFYEALCDLSSGLLHLINPSYYALEFFINLVK